MRFSDGAFVSQKDYTICFLAEGDNYEYRSGTYLI